MGSARSVRILFHYVIFIMLSKRFKGRNREGGREILIVSEEDRHLLSPSKNATKCTLTAVTSYPDGFDQSPTSQVPEIQLDADRTLVLEYS